MLAAALSFFVILGVPAPDTVKEIYEISCFDDGTVIGVAGAFRVAWWEGSAWRSSSIRGGHLWHSPDDRVFVVDSGQVVEELGREPKSLTRWHLASEIGYPRLIALDGIVAVTNYRMLRLAPAGRIVDLGRAPVAPDGFRHQPVVFDDRGRRIMCYGTSDREQDAGQGFCFAPSPNKYDYPADFGDWSPDHDKYVTPFRCGGAIVSTHRGVTRARDLVTGKVLGQAPVGALRGSSCLPGERAFLVGEHDVSIVEVPGLRTTWRRSLRVASGNAAVCGNRVAFVREHETAVNFIELPPG